VKKRLIADFTAAVCVCVLVDSQVAPAWADWTTKPSATDYYSNSGSYQTPPAGGWEGVLNQEIQQEQARRVKETSEQSAEISTEIESATPVESTTPPASTQTNDDTQTQQQVNNPYPQQQVYDPTSQQQVYNPTLQQQVYNPNSQQQVYNPYPQQQVYIPNYRVNPGYRSQGLDGRRSWSTSRNRHRDRGIDGFGMPWGRDRGGSGFDMPWGGDRGDRGFDSPWGDDGFGFDGPWDRGNRGRRGGLYVPW